MRSVAQDEFEKRCEQILREQEGSGKRAIRKDFLKKCLSAFAKQRIMSVLDVLKLFLHCLFLVVIIKKSGKAEQLRKPVAPLFVDLARSFFYRTDHGIGIMGRVGQAFQRLFLLSAHRRYKKSEDPCFCLIHIVFFFYYLIMFICFSL